MSQAAAYWKEVYELRDQLFKTHGPVVFVVSIKPPRGVMTTPGAVGEATAMLAAQRITDGTHELATEEQIRQWHEHQKDQAKLINQMERRNAKQRRGVTSEVE